MPVLRACPYLESFPVCTYVTLCSGVLVTYELYVCVCICVCVCLCVYACVQHHKTEWPCAQPPEVRGVEYAADSYDVRGQSALVPAAIHDT